MKPNRSTKSVEFTEAYRHVLNSDIDEIRYMNRSKLHLFYILFVVKQVVPEGAN